MSYNRWMPVQCSSELYHHGVKGMKWGRHLFGKGADVQAGAGGGGGGLLEEEPDDEDLKKAKALYEQLYSELHSMSAEDMARIGNVKLGAMYKAYYAALDDYKAKQADYDKRKAEYEKTLSYKIKNPGQAIKKALDKADSAISSKKIDIEYGIKDKIGTTAKNAKQKAEKAYEQAKSFDDRAKKYNSNDTYYEPEVAKAKAEYDNALKDYYKTPIGKIDMYKTAIKNAKDFVNSPKVNSWDAYYDAYDAKHSKSESSSRSIPTGDSAVKKSAKLSNKPAGPKKTTLREAQNVQSNPHPNLPRSRKRNVTGKGTGVHIGQTVLPPEPKPLTLISDTNRRRSRKRNVTGKGTGVHVHGPGLNGGRKG